jgi:hypothetical protein
MAIVAIAAMLDAGRDRRGEPLFGVKGGSALELRYEARATRDIDLDFAGTLYEIHRTLTKCVDAGWPGFNGRGLEPQPLSIPWGSITGQRLTVRPTYLDRPFANIPLEVVTRKSPEIEYVHALQFATRVTSRCIVAPTAQDLIVPLREPTSAIPYAAITLFIWIEQRSRRSIAG